MKWKEKSLAIVAGPYTWLGTLLLLQATKGQRWAWRVADGLEALGSWLDVGGRSESSFWHRIAKASSLFYAKNPLLCDLKIPVKRRIHPFYSTCVAAAPHGAGEWVDTINVSGSAHLEAGKRRRVSSLRRRANETLGST